MNVCSVGPKWWAFPLLHRLIAVYDVELGSGDSCVNMTPPSVDCVYSVTVTGFTAWVSLDFAAMLHGTMVGQRHGFTNVGLPALQHLLLVQFLVHAERHQLGAGQPLPACTHRHTRLQLNKAARPHLKAH